jgi:hypothetical protein
MKTLNEILKTILLGIILSGIIYLVFFNKPPASPPVIVTTHDTLYKDTMFVPVPFQLPPDTFIKKDTIPVPANADTSQILKDFFARYHYSDTIRQDSAFSIVIKDIISQNKILSRDLWYKDLSPTVVNTTTTTYQENKREFYYGAMINVGKTSGISANLMYKDKGSRIYLFGYDPLNKQISAGVTFKFK